MLFGLVFCLRAQADLTIEITQGVDNPTIIGIVPFGWSGTRGLPEDIPEIVRADLTLSGQFRSVPVKDMLAFPRAEAEVIYRDWRILGTEFLVTGDIQEVAGRFTVTFELFDILGQRKVFRKTVAGSESQLRDLAHFISDEVYEKITGIRGAFSTQVLYVEAFQQSLPTDRFRLMLADADGARPRLLLESKHPLMSPTWSADGKRVAYVSFETGRAAIFVQELATARREQVTNFKGLNGAPAFSPDGERLALVLSKDGNPELYTLHLGTRQLSRVTQHFAIDTEPSWTPDGKALVFTSNRGGKPQIYKVTLATGIVERLTFAGDYNARARVSPDGKSLVMVHRSNGVFHIATQDIQSGDLRVLTETYLDESPSIAPNGAMLMYATRFQGKGILAAVSLDAGVKFRLPSKQGDVREPAWSPFFD
nr:Tol-Pal system beta propeller repeat protein TolB [Simiduia aestuariiviva]